MTYRRVWGWTVSALLSFAGTLAHAGVITQTVNLTASGSNNNVTNGHILTVFDLIPSFNQFNPATGTLVSATLGWSASGHLTVAGNNEGQAIMSYETSSDTETWNIYGGSTGLTFSISGSESLNLAAVTGTGSFPQGHFKETYQLQQGFFPASFTTGETASAGTFTLTYDYTTANDTASTPEPASFLYVSPAMAGFAFWLRRRVRRQPARL